MKPKVSIIIPIYNSEHYISSAVTSVFSQTYSNIEVIIVDDGSTDSSHSCAMSFESSRCKIVKQVNSGAAVARNNGLAHATGKYVQFLDVDDFLSADKIEKQVEALESQTQKVAVCNYIEFFNDDDLSKSKEVDQSSFIYSSDSPVDFLINLYGGYGKPNFIQTNSWLVPRSIIDKVGGWRNYRCPDDDGEFFARVLLASEGIIHIPGVYNFYRRTINEVSLSSSTKRKYLQNSLLTIDLKHSYLIKFTESKALAKAIASQYLLFAVFAFPRHKSLSAIAYSRYKSLSSKVDVPVLGGSIIEFIKKTLGWKTARHIKYYLRERRA